MTNDYERNLCELWGSVPTPLKKVPDVTTQTKPDDKTPMERAQEKFEADVNAKVLLDAMKRMDFLQRNGGSPIELCVYAGIVTVALVQVRDEARYREWQPIEEGLCRKAGMR